MLSALFNLIDLQTVLIFLCVTLGMLKFMKLAQEKHRYKLPPGPLAFPLIGNLIQLAGKSNIFRTFDEYGKTYGDMFTIYIGGMRTVVVTSYDKIHEGLVDKGKSLIGRPNDLYIVDKIFQRKGVIWSLGDVWRDTRRFALMSLRDFGVGKTSLEERIQDEADLLMTEIRACNGRPFVPRKFLSMAVMNIMCGIIRGSRYEKDDPVFKELLKMLEFLFKNAGLQVPENFFPLLRYLPIGSPAKELVQNDNALRKVIREEIQKHRETFDEENIRDFMDLYLKMTKEEPWNPSFTEDNVFRTIVDLFLAGSETTAASLNWLVLYMVRYPDVQKRCQQEIQKVIASSRKIGLKDRHSLPYVSATIHELQRIANTAPITVPHKAIEDVEIGGYFLPKDTIIVFSIYGAHRDPKYWENADKFDPGRWLSPEGELIKHKAFVPFGDGPRTCLGKILSEMELFLFFTNIIKNFTFKTVPGKALPSLEPVQRGISMQIHPYEVVAEENDIS
ncbi:cytochrome P450 2H1-like [Liolophura sinensis]|uniref:cytochrome P450 2H1-like n=1 Tax=Liolophura sinensis TaxID=3198878 RepID=UPI0031588EC8